VAKRTKSKTPKTVSDGGNLVATYVSRLKAAGLQKSTFDEVFAALAADKLAKKGDVLTIASAYVGISLRARSRKDSLNMIEKKFVELVRFEEKQRIA
jgi:hypothetical protein